MRVCKAQAITDALAQSLPAQVTVLEIHQLAPCIATTGKLPPEGAAAVQAIEAAAPVPAVAVAATV